MTHKHARTHTHGVTFLAIMGIYHCAILSIDLLCIIDHNYRPVLVVRCNIDPVYNIVDDQLNSNFKEALRLHL